MKTLPIDHIGIAVRDLDEELPLYHKRFGVEAEERQLLEERGVELCFLNFGNTRLELIAPIKGSSTSPLLEFLKNRGPGLHHICYRTDNIRAEMKRLSDQGARLIDKEPRPGAKGSIIAFIHMESMGGVLTELCQIVAESKVS